MRRVAIALLALGCAACSGGTTQVDITSSSGTSSAVVARSTPAARTTGSPSSSPSTTRPAAPYIGTLRWVGGRHGNDLIVTPTTAGRTVTDQAAEAAAWNEVVRRAPTANTVSMQRQFDCHWRYARGKQTWNLEPWRPTVSMDDVIAAYCNPGGPE